MRNIRFIGFVVAVVLAGAAVVIVLVQRPDATGIGQPVTVDVGDGPIGVAFDGTSIWITNRASDTVSKIDPTTGTVTATIDVGDNPVGVAVGGRHLWVADISSGVVSKLVASTSDLVGP